MAFLGAVPVDASITVRVVWTPAPGSPSITGSTLTFVHEDGATVVGGLAGEADGASTFKVSTSLPRSGRWRVRWITTPPGGASDDVIYAQ